MLTLAQVVISILLIALILIQERSSGLSGVFGGGVATPYQTRRGLEKIIFGATIASLVIFVLLSVVSLLI